MQGQSQQGQNPNQALEDFGYSLAAFLFGLGAGYVSAKVGRPALGKNDDKPCGVSIVIPTKNEEKHLPELLKSIRGQDFKEYEIIVVDAYSTDRTPDIAKEYDVKFIQDQSFQARAQNLGVKASKYRHLMFLDADVVLPRPTYFREVMEYTHEHGIVHANFHTKCYMEDQFPKLMYDQLLNDIGAPFQELNVLTNCIDYAYAMWVDRDVFFMANGFREDLKISQGTDFIDRCGVRPVILPLNLWLFTSDRRFRSNGLLPTVLELIKGNLCARLGIPVQTNYWEPSVGLDVGGQHLRAKDSGLHAVIKGNDILVHMDQVPAHKDPIGHIIKDVLKQ